MLEWLEEAEPLRVFLHGPVGAVSLPPPLPLPPASLADRDVAERGARFPSHSGRASLWLSITWVSKELRHFPRLYRIGPGRGGGGGALPAGGARHGGGGRQSGGCGSWETGGVPPPAGNDRCLGRPRNLQTGVELARCDPAGTAARPAGPAPRGTTGFLRGDLATTRAEMSYWRGTARPPVAAQRALTLLPGDYREARPPTVFEGGFFTSASAGRGVPGLGSRLLSHGMGITVE